MYIARKITNIHKFYDWRFYHDSSEECLADLDKFSSVLDYDDNPRKLKRRVLKRLKGQFEVVFIFRDRFLDSKRNMALDNRWSKSF